MKGFLVVNRINDVFFLDFDKEFTAHTTKQAKEQGLLQPDDDAEELDSNVVMQLFSPLFMSQWFLIEQQKNPCSSITCENGFVFVFKQYEDFLIIAISGNSDQTEQVLHKKINIFIKMLEFLYGPVTDEIGYSQFCRRSERWKFLKEVLATWEKLRLEEHAFLVEAIERLHVNLLVNEKCMELLESAANKFQSAGEKNTQHTLLVVNSKLLSLFSNRNAPSLHEADTLCIILLVKMVFPNDEKLEDLFSCSYRKPDSEAADENKSPASTRITSPVDKYESALEGEDSADDQDQYLSASEVTTIPESPYPAMSEQPGEDEFTTPTEGEQKPFHFPDVQKEEEQRGRAESNGRQRSRTLENVHAGWEKNLSGRVTPGVGRARSRSLIETVKTGPEVDNQTVPEQKETVPIIPQEIRASHFHVRHTAFLTTEMCQHSPHQLHFIHIFPGMVLVLLTEIPRSSHANSLCQLIHFLKDLISGRKNQVQRAQGHVLYDLINTLLEKLAAAMKRAKGNLESILEDIRKRWDNAEFKSSLIGYLEQGAGSEIPPRGLWVQIARALCFKLRSLSPLLSRVADSLEPSTERSLAALQKKVKELFMYLYIYPYEITPAVVQAVAQLRDKARNKLWDFKDYLSVKAQRNIVMTSYFDVLPGLVHFIYIDRRTNQLTAPSLNIVSKDATELDATQFLKDKIWKITEWILCKLNNGVTMVIAREGDYCFSYHLWFEDYQGNVRSVQSPFQEGDISVPPGILSGNFYKMLKSHCFPNVVPGSVNCYELIMMHVGLVNTQYIANHRKKLASMFYEAVGDNPMSLGF